MAHGTNDVGFSFWYLSQDNGDAAGVIFDTNGNGNDLNWPRLFVSGGDLYIRWNSVDFNFGALPVDGLEHQITINVDGPVANMTAYADNVALPNVGTSPSYSLAAPTNLAMGAEAGAVTNTFNGWIDEFKIKNGTYDAGERTALLAEYNAGSPLLTTNTAWYDLQATNTVSTALGRISGIEDRGGDITKEVTQGNVSQQPDLALLNGMTACDFAQPNGDTLFKTSFDTTGVDDFAILFFAESLSSVTPGQAVVSMNGGANPDLSIDSDIFSSYRPRINANNGLGTDVAPGLVRNGPSVYGARFDASGLTMYLNVDGVVLGSNTYNGDLTDSSTFRLGTDRGASNYFDGPVSNLIFVNTSALATFQALEGYLAWRQAPTVSLGTGNPNLPIAHPFKNAPPKATDF
jgi:hypothetical protein